MWDETAPSFPVVRSGYDRAAVDEYLAELEREIDELRATGPATTNTAVSDEIKKIGEQTAAILQTAHQQASETTRKAQAEADKCLSDAAANAISMKEEAKQQLRHLDTETDAVWHERSRLIEDVRTVATALTSLAEQATDRFPPEEERRLASRMSGPVISRMTPPASAATSSQARPQRVGDRRSAGGRGPRARTQSSTARMTSEALTTAVTADPSCSPSSCTASTVIEATRRWPPTSSATLAIASPLWYRGDRAVELVSGAELHAGLRMIGNSGPTV